MRTSATNALRGASRSTRLTSTSALRRSTLLHPCIFCQTQQPQSRNLSSTRPRLEQSSPPSNSSSRESLIPQTHYDIFPSLGSDAIPPKGPFTLDLSLLKREFLQLQARTHPDQAPASKKRQAEAASARINEAYKTLQQPLTRAQYILSLRGIDVAEDETAKLGEEDQELLMEVLETREVIEEAEAEEDLVGLRAQNEERVVDSVGVLEEAFGRDDLEGAKREAVKLRYWINIRESIDAWERGKPVVLAH